MVFMETLFKNTNANSLVLLFNLNLVKKNVLKLIFICFLKKGNKKYGLKLFEMYGNGNHIQKDSNERTRILQSFIIELPLLEV